MTKTVKKQQDPPNIIVPESEKYVPELRQMLKNYSEIVEQICAEQTEASIQRSGLFDMAKYEDLSLYPRV